MSPQSERDDRIDVARGLGVLLVLYAHSLEPLFIREDSTFVQSAFVQWRYIYSFHMPLFFLLSGAARAAGRRTVTPLRHTVRDAIALLLLVQFGQLVGGALFAADLWLHGVRDVAALLKPTVRGSILLCDLRLGILWYLVSLAIVSILSALWSSQRPLLTRPLVLLVCGVSFVAGLRVGPAWDVTANWFQIRSLMPGLVFFALGRALAGRYPPVWLGLLGLLALGFVAPLNLGCPLNPFDTCPDVANVFAPWMILGRHGFLPLFYGCALLGCLGVLGSTHILRSRVLRYFGQVSLPLYLVNAVFLEFVLMKLSRMEMPEQVSVVGYLGIFAGTVLLHVAAVFLLRRPIEAMQAASKRWAQQLVDGVLQPLWLRIREGRAAAQS